MYAADAVPVPETSITELEFIQNQIGKSLLGVHQSSANTVIHVELGWKPIQLLIEPNNFHRVSNPNFIGSSLAKSCFKWNMSNPQTLYYINLMLVLCKYATTSPHVLKGVTPKQLHQYHEKKAISDIQELITLKLMPLPMK